MNQTTSSLLTELKLIRSISRHSPSRIVEIGESLLERGYLKNSPEEGWAFLEQLCIAAVECGKLGLANICAERLSTRFPNSPRVDVLIGSIMEGKGLLMEAEKFYLSLMENEEGGNINIRKRRIALHLSSPHAFAPSSPSTSLTKSKPTSSSSSSITTDLNKVILPNRTTGLELLISYLDTFYTDLEAWSELSHIYSSLGLYQQSLSAISNLILLAPHNPIYLLLHAETAYTAKDYNLAYLEFLRVIEMDQDSTTSSLGGGMGKGGVGFRAILGVKMCLQKLPQTTKNSKLDLILTESILKCQTDVVNRDLIGKWIAGESS